MSYQIAITEVAKGQLRGLPARDQRQIEQSIASKLTHQPTLTSRAIQRLRSNRFADYELRSGDFRILYNVVGQTVVIRLIGQKIGNKLIVEGREFDEHQDDSAQPTDGAPGTNAD